MIQQTRYIRPFSLVPLALGVPACPVPWECEAIRATVGGTRYAIGKVNNDFCSMTKGGMSLSITNCDTGEAVAVTGIMLKLGRIRKDGAEGRTSFSCKALGVSVSGDEYRATRAVGMQALLAAHIERESVRTLVASNPVTGGDPLTFRVGGMA